MQNYKRFDIYARVFRFGIEVAALINKLPKDLVLLEYSKQLVRSSGSVGANLEEADGALSRKDFINKVGISRREAQESHHWLRLVSSRVSEKELYKQEIELLIRESKEIALILSSIINKTKENY